MICRLLLATDFKCGDLVEWNSEAGPVRGTIQKKVTSVITFKGYMRHASKGELQYIIIDGCASNASVAQTFLSVLRLAQAGMPVPPIPMLHCLRSSQ
jgi:hypothetical protein